MSTTAAHLLPATLRLGAVHLTVADLDRSVAWYRRALGLRVHSHDATVAALGDGGFGVRDPWQTAVVLVSWHPPEQREETSMDVTIIGTGNMGRGIATRALAGGHDITLLGTAPGKAEALARELSGNVRAGAVGDELQADVVVLAIPYAAIDDVLGRYQGQLDGTVVVDITNPVDFASFTPVSVPAGSAAQEIAQKAPGAKVAKAFNTTFAGTLVEGNVAGQPLDVLIASDDDDAKRTVSQLAEDGGLRAVDAGPLARAHELEALGYLHMALQEPLGTGFSSTVKIVS